jgi:hypothetical protein
LAQCPNPCSAWHMGCKPLRLPRAGGWVIHRDYIPSITLGITQIMGYGSLYGVVAGTPAGLLDT